MIRGVIGWTSRQDEAGPGGDLTSDLWEALGLSGGWLALLQPMSFEGGTSLTYEGDDQEGTR